MHATGSHVPALADPSMAGSVITEERLEAAGARTAELLRAQPGVGVTETGGYGSLSTATIRGGCLVNDALNASAPTYWLAIGGAFSGVYGFVASTGANPATSKRQVETSGMPTTALRSAS